MSGLSRDMIIHPGETLREVMEDRNMSQQEFLDQDILLTRLLKKILKVDKC